MGRPKDGYYMDDERVPGATTIIGRFKPAGGLIAWAHKLGLEGKDYREVRDAAANAGTIAHDMVEADIHGRAYDPTGLDPGLLEKARGAFDAYVSWRSMTRLTVVETEVPLVSRQHRFGGTFDAIGTIDGRLCLLDWKTSNACYAEYLIQLAAYQLLIRECRPDLALADEVHLLRFSKQEHPEDPVSFSHHYWSDVGLATEQFLLYRQAYELDKRIAKLV